MGEKNSVITDFCGTLGEHASHYQLPEMKR